MPRSSWLDAFRIRVIRLLETHPYGAQQVDQRGRTMYLERFIHGEIYKARLEVNAVVHSHSPAVVPFSVSSVTLKPVSHMSAFLHRGVPCSRFAMPRE